MGHDCGCWCSTSDNHGDNAAKDSHSTVLRCLSCRPCTAHWQMVRVGYRYRANGIEQTPALCLLHSISSDSSLPSFASHIAWLHLTLPLRMIARLRYPDHFALRAAPQFLLPSSHRGTISLNFSVSDVPMQWTGKSRFIVVVIR